MAMSYGGPIDDTWTHAAAKKPPYFDCVDQALACNKKTGILSSLNKPWPLTHSVLFRSPLYPECAMRIHVDLLTELIPAAQEQGIDTTALQQGLDAYHQSGGATLAQPRVFLFDHDVIVVSQAGFEWATHCANEMYGKDCSLAHLQRLKFVEYKTEEQAVLNRFIFTDPQEPKAVYEFSDGQLQAWLKNAGDDKKLIPEFVKAQKQAQKDNYIGMAIAGVAVVGMACTAVWAVQKADDHIAQRYFDPDEVVSNHATGRYLVNTERGTVADSPLPTTVNQPVTVYNVFDRTQKEVELNSWGYYSETLSQPVTDYKKLGQVVAAWNRVQGKIDVNAERLTEIFAREAKLATELQAAREMRQSAVARP